MREYALVPQLRSYLIVDPVFRAVDLYRLQDGEFAPVNAGDSLDLGHNLAVSLDDIYRGVL